MSAHDFRNPTTLEITMKLEKLQAEDKNRQVTILNMKFNKIISLIILFNLPYKNTHTYYG